MIVRRPETTAQDPLTGGRRPTVIPATRNPGSFTGWGPKL